MSLIPLVKEDLKPPINEDRDFGFRRRNPSPCRGDSPQGRQIATEDIIEQLRTKLPKLPATQEEPSIYGLRFEVQVTIQGLNGKEGNLITKWQIDRGKTKPRLISNWLKFPQSRETKNES